VIIQTVICKLTNIPSETGNIIKILQYLNYVKKKKGYQMLAKVGNILCGNYEDLPEYFTPNIVIDIKFAPLISVDIERSFSLYKQILSDRRTNMSTDNM
jgi:hypothetical protein